MPYQVFILVCMFFLSGLLGAMYWSGLVLCTVGAGVWSYASMVVYPELE